MGWMYTTRHKGQSLKKFFEGRVGVEPDYPGRKILDFAVVRLRTAYAAFQVAPGEVIALVFLLDFNGDGHFPFGYKDMEESMGPCEDECPERILKLLTPTTSEYALGWRKRCWARIEARKARPRLTHGCVIRLDHALEFSDGARLDTFHVEMTGRRKNIPVFKRVPGASGRYRFNWREAAYTLVDEAEPTTTPSPRQPPPSGPTQRSLLES